MKTCKHCNEEMDELLFQSKHQCIKCYKKYQAAYRAANKAYWKKYREDHKEEISAKKQELRKARKLEKEAGLNSIDLRNQYIIEYLKNNPCMDCGENDLLVLEFDHRVKETKSYNICVLRRNGPGSKLKDEISKCDVVCANCHKKRTAKQVNSWRLDHI